MNIIYENTDYLIIDKPVGLIVENNPFESPTVESLVEDHLKKSKKKPYVGIVHRLDRVTSGVMVFAKKKGILRLLNESFRLKQIQKVYYAIVDQKPPEQEGTLRHFLFKDQKNKRAEIFTTAENGTNPCALHYKVLHNSDQYYLLEIIPESGKFHQIRAQLSFVGCPIVGDEKYGSKTEYQPLSICLHARELGFNNPTNNNKKENYKANLPTSTPWSAFIL
jgi:23S rRNA pseudouridine1911/1915/1917 synthase